MIEIYIKYKTNIWKCGYFVLLAHMGFCLGFSALRIPLEMEMWNKYDVEDREEQIDGPLDMDTETKITSSEK